MSFDDALHDAPPSGKSTSRFGVLFISLLSSGIFLFIVRELADQPQSPVPYWSSIVAALIPLIWYHNYLARLAKKGLSQTEIDSVYYFGFLITVMALGASALSMVHSDTSLNLSPVPVITQFGVGLFATGYAVIARMHLSSLSTQSSNAEDALNNYVIKSREMIDNIDITLGRFENLARKSQSAESALGDLSGKILEQHSAALKEIALSFNGAMENVIVDAKASVMEVREVISDPAIATERKAFARNIKAVSDATAGLQQAASDLKGEFEDIGRATGGVVEQVGRSAEHVRDLSEAANDAGRNLHQASGQFAALAGGAAALGETFAKAASDLATATERVKLLTLQSTDQLEGAVKRTSDALATAVKDATDAATMLTTKLVSVADIIIEETQKRN